MSQQTEIEKIKNIMGKSSDDMSVDESLNYSFDEKCTAIFNWAQKSDVVFDTTMVEGIAANVKKYKKPTHNQMRAINNIITQFRIDVSNWAY